MENDFTKYNSVEEIVTDIKNVKIQGATNVAIAVLEGMKLYVKSREYGAEQAFNYEQFVTGIQSVGDLLASARANEPLAKNGVKYLITNLRLSTIDKKSNGAVIKIVEELAENYLEIVKNAKKQIIEKNAGVLGYASGILTHCHSSTSEALIIDHVKKDASRKVVCTETRPLYQGRITATNLLNAGLDTTLIADSAVESFIIGRGTFPVDAVLIGADEITMKGDAINKIGSWGIANAAYFASKPIYVVSSILKVNVASVHEKTKIEMRESREIWPEAPLGLKIVNPAFDFIDGKLISGYLTELGLIKPEEIEKAIHENYEWLF